MRRSRFGLLGVREPCRRQQTSTNQTAPNKALKDKQNLESHGPRLMLGAPLPEGQAPQGGYIRWDAKCPHPPPQRAGRGGGSGGRERRAGGRQRVRGRGKCLQLKRTACVQQ